MANKHSIGDLAAEIVRQVEVENMVKTAAEQPVKTETVQELLKLAALCRTVEEPVLTYADIQGLMNHAR